MVIDDLTDVHASGAQPHQVGIGQVLLMAEAVVVDTEDLVGG
jgi:hypothetical protein